MKLFNKDGIEMMDVKSIDRDGERLIVKGKVMGSMSTTIYVRPEDIYAALRLFPFAVIVRLPWLLITGYLRARKTETAKA
jgi:hypothetical protein